VLLGAGIVTVHPLFVPEVPFGKIQGRLSRLWDPFERNPHVAVFGVTGSGKSNLIRHGILPLRAYSRTVVIDVKDDRDSVWSGFGTPVSELPRAFAHGGDGPAKSRYRLIVNRADAQAQLRRVFDQIRDEGHCLIVVDESRSITEREQVGLGSVVENLILEGRGLGITMIMGAQSTAWAVPSLKDQPAVLLIGQTQGTEQAQALAKIAGHGPDLAATIGQIQARRFLYADTLDGPRILALTTPPGPQ
jgi:energy-coupling factor transporter ATP-binding protein EcfA2